MVIKKLFFPSSKPSFLSSKCCISYISLYLFCVASVDMYTFAKLLLWYIHQIKNMNKFFFRHEMKEFYARWNFSYTEQIVFSIVFSSFINLGCRKKMMMMKKRVNLCFYFIFKSLLYLISWLPNFFLFSPFSFLNDAWIYIFQAMNTNTHDLQAVSFLL